MKTHAVASMHTVCHRAAASCVDSCAFAFTNGVRYFSELFYYSFYFRNIPAIRPKRRCAC